MERVRTPAQLEGFNPRRVTHHRLMAGYSRPEVCRSAGLDLRTLVRLERGETTPRWSTLRCVAEVLGVDVLEFFDHY